MASSNEIDNSTQRFSTERNVVDPTHLSKEINWRFATELPPLPEYKFSHNLTLVETNQVEVGNMKLAMSCSSDKDGSREVEKFVSGNDKSAVSYQRLDRSKSELESHLGRALEPGEQAWSVAGGGIGKSNGFSDKEFIGKVTYDAAKNAVIVDVSYPVKQQIIYNSDGSSEHQFENGVKTFTPAKHGDTDRHHETVDGPNHRDVVVQSADGQFVSLDKREVIQRQENQLNVTEHEHRFARRIDQQHHQFSHRSHVSVQDSDYRYSTAEGPNYRILPNSRFVLPPVVLEDEGVRVRASLSNKDLQIKLEL